MAELLSQNQLLILMINEVHLLVGDQILDPLVDFGARSHGCFNILRELLSDLVTDLLDKLRLDT